jgi:molybdate transport system regulatory protein
MRRWTEMQISARNKIPGKVKEIKLGAILAEVTIDTGVGEIAAIITKSSADSLDLKVGDSVFAVIKATEVIVGK